MGLDRVGKLGIEVCNFCIMNACRCSMFPYPSPSPLHVLPSVCFFPSFPWVDGIRFTVMCFPRLAVKSAKLFKGKHPVITNLLPLNQSKLVYNLPLLALTSSTSTTSYQSLFDQRLRVFMQMHTMSERAAVLLLPVVSSF